MKTTMAILLMLFAATATYGDCPAGRAQILILGTYHFDNPGQDKINLQADDVLAPKRQAEIDAVIEKLARFHPTKVAIEAPYRSAAWPERYKQYLAGSYMLGRNEIEQIGFKLAKRLNLPVIYPVDYPMWMNGWTPAEMELPRSKANAKWDSDAAKKSDAPPPPPSKPLSAEDEILRKSTVEEYLRRLNSPAKIAENSAAYLNLLLPGDSVGIYANTDEVTNWYKRNLRIFTNINRITDFPSDRILLVIGAGHLRTLKNLASDAPYFCLVDASPYLE